MEREVFLKNLIQEKYGNVKAFSEEADIPYTTVRSILERGVGKAGIDTVLKMCKYLGISPEQLSNEEIKNEVKHDILELVNSLNQERKQSVYNFAKEQLEEQNSKVIKLERPIVDLTNEVLYALDGKDVSEEDRKKAEEAIQAHLDKKNK